MHKIFLIIILLFGVFFCYSKELSSGYKDIKLGMSIEDVKKLINKIVDFNPKNEEILTIRIDPDKEIISTEGKGFIDTAYFHFYKGKLYQILLNFNENKIGYYLLLKNNTDNFGKPSKLDPKSARWDSHDVFIVIEKPCTMKYFYVPIWNELIKNDQTPDDVINKTRNDFINDL